MDDVAGSGRAGRGDRRLDPSFWRDSQQEIPEYPLIVVDEYQDFSELETSFIRLLSSKSPVLIAGDDDQALYSFKNADPRFIRELAQGDEYERFGLPFCSRCTEVVVGAVNDGDAPARFGAHGTSARSESQDRRSESTWPQPRETSLSGPSQTR